MAVTRYTIRISDQLRVVLNRHVDQTIRELVTAWARAWEQVAPEWEAAIEVLVEASREGRWPTPTQVARAKQAQRALQVTTKAIMELADLTGVRVVATAREVTGETALWQARLIASQMPAEAGTQAELLGRFARVDSEAIGAIVERTTEQIESLRRPLADTASEAMKQALVRGVAIGENPKVAARRMIRLSQDRFLGGLTRAMVLARTEILDAHRSAAAAHHFEHEDVLSGWAWQAKLDSRTCPSCWVQHGTVHQLHEPGPNDHQQGRCARLPVVKSWADLGFTDIEEPPSLLGDARATFDALSRNEKLRIMGPVRLQALDTGSVDWADLSVKRKNPGWRTSWVPASVGDTRRRLLTPVG